MIVMAVKFYDVKGKASVDLTEAQVKKTTYSRVTKSGATQVRYALRGTLSDGRKVTKFVNKATWDSMQVPTE